MQRTTSAFLFSLIGLLLASAAGARAANYTAGADTAVKFGVHEIVLIGNRSVANPFDAAATVKFVPPSGEELAKTVCAFYDGDGTWRARVYVSETGTWRWSSACATDQGLAGKSGTFRAVDSKLHGRLLPHTTNPRQWMTEDGRWFLNLIDTAYYLFCDKDKYGNPISFADCKKYVKDAADRGVTSFFVTPGWDDGSDGWDGKIFSDREYSRFRLEEFQRTDQRLKWLLEHHPDMHVEVEMFPRGAPYATDETFWSALTVTQRERALGYMVARLAAFPEIMWLAINDAHYGPNYPNNNTQAREIGEYLRKHDPWQHPRSTGHARFVDFYFGDENWATFLHLENAYDLGASQYAKYQRFAKPVLMGEERYEQDHPDRDPTDMRYYQRRLDWAWLFSGGAANYGGRWWVLHPYSETGKRTTPNPWHKGVVHKAPLRGLDSVRFIRDYFTTRKIELSDFEPDHGLAADLDGRTGAQAPTVMRRDREEFLIYHPNAGADGKQAHVDSAKKARLRLDLEASPGRFSVEWYRAEDGASQGGGTIEGTQIVEFVSPWTGHDVVLRVRRREK